MSQTNVVRDSARSEIIRSFFSFDIPINAPVKSQMSYEAGVMYRIMHPLRTQIIMKMLLDNVNRLNWTRK